MPSRPSSRSLVAHGARKPDGDGRHDPCVRQIHHRRERRGRRARGGRRAGEPDRLAQRPARRRQVRHERQPGQLQRPGDERARRRRRSRLPAHARRLRPGADHQRLPQTTTNGSGAPTSSPSTTRAAPPTATSTSSTTSSRTRGGTKGRSTSSTPSGEYIGKLDETQVTPDSRKTSTAVTSASVSVASNGVIYSSSPARTSPCTHVDRYVPIDGVPGTRPVRRAAPRRRAPTRSASPTSPHFAGGAGGLNYYYAWRRRQDPRPVQRYYVRFPRPSSTARAYFNFAVSERLHPRCRARSATAAYCAPVNGYLSTIGIDPANQHVYIGQRLGPASRSGTNRTTRSARSFAASGQHRRSDGHDRLRSVRRAATTATSTSAGPDRTEIAVFGPPVTIPDINDPTVGSPATRRPS